MKGRCFSVLIKAVTWSGLGILSRNISKAGEREVEWAEEGDMAGELATRGMVGGDG